MRKKNKKTQKKTKKNILGHVAKAVLHDLIDQ
jgi:hypothetical protein